LGQGDKSEGAGIGDQSALTAADFLYFSINYRLAPEYKFPAMIEDVKCAVRYLRAHASQYNLDPQRVGALGGSAGGHLVSLLGLSNELAGWDVVEYLDQSSRVQAVVDYFGPADLTDSSFDTERAENRAVEVFGATNQSDPLLAAASPVTYATPDDPPFFIAHGDKDDTFAACAVADPVRQAGGDRHSGRIGDRPQCRAWLCANRWGDQPNADADFADGGGVL
jgi:acetyl esterase/lipase